MYFSISLVYAGPASRVICCTLRQTAMSPAQVTCEVRAPTSSPPPAGWAAPLCLDPQPPPANAADPAWPPSPPRTETPDIRHLSVTTPISDPLIFTPVDEVIFNIFWIYSTSVYLLGHLNISVNNVALRYVLKNNTNNNCKLCLELILE